MHRIAKLIILLALTQLTACAVMSKKECLNADWQQVGYKIGNNGNTDVSNAFNRRAQACVKHGATANWHQFKQGHSDGLVQFCQLDNAVELGVKGATSVIKKATCPEHHYPGFQNAFDAGYQLYILNSRVRETEGSISSANHYIYNYKKRIGHINKELSVESLNANQRKRLISERRQLKDDIYQLKRDIQQYQRYLYNDVDARRRYSDFLYIDYLGTISDEFVDPRDHMGVD